MEGESGRGMESRLVQLFYEANFRVIKDMKLEFNAHENTNRDIEEQCKARKTKNMD